MRRIHEKDPALTPQKLEKEIAHCIGAKLNELIRDSSEHIIFLQEAIKKYLDLSCEVAPSLALYVSVTSESNESSQKSVADSPSSQFEKALQAIMERDFTAMPDELILQLTDDAINTACKIFLNSVVLSHPLVTKIFQRFTDVFHEQLAVTVRNPVRIIINMGEPPQNATASYTPQNMYL